MGEYEDITRRCVEKQCGNQEFVITANEVQFFTEKGFQLPKRCKDCRERRKRKQLHAKIRKYNKRTNRWAVALLLLLVADLATAFFMDVAWYFRVAFTIAESVAVWCAVLNLYRHTKYKGEYDGMTHLLATAAAKKMVATLLGKLGQGGEMEFEIEDDGISVTVKQEKEVEVPVRTDGKETPVLVRTPKKTVHKGGK